jgi:hypothetical protein
VAQKLGIARDSIMRVLAGIMHALLEAAGEGHCARLSRLSNCDVFDAVSVGYDPARGRLAEEK